MAITYKDAGVDIDAGAQLVDRVRPLAASTARPEVIGGLGGFAGLCAIPAGYREPLLVAGTDGVGTKLMTALATGVHDTVGIDLVAMCVNDVAVTGAEPLLFLDYYGTGRLDVDVATRVIAGIAEGCRQAGCALIGGETAELPGLYAAGDYDLVGFCLGIVERAEVRDGSDLAEGDVLIGLPSTGLHSNGHSLARKALLEVRGFGYDDRPPELRGASIGEELLRPTRIYVPALRALAQSGVRFKAAAHITGGGLIENPPRILRDETLAIELRPDSWVEPPVFALIGACGVDRAEMQRTFNLGLGMVIACAADDTDRALAAARAAGDAAAVVGRIARRRGEPVVFA